MQLSPSYTHSPCVGVHKLLDSMLSAAVELHVLLCLLWVGVVAALLPDCHAEQPQAIAMECLVLPAPCHETRTC